MSDCRVSLNILGVAEPCHVPWRKMSGGDKVRYCTQCSKSVYNVSAMTSAEAEAMLGATESPCVRFYRRADGTVVTSDRCGGRWARAWRRIALAMSAMVALFGGAGCWDQGKKTTTMGKPAWTSSPLTSATKDTTSVDRTEPTKK